MASEEVASSPRGGPPGGLGFDATPTNAAPQASPRASKKLSKNLKNRIPEFVYTYDFDTSGIIYYLGSNRWTVSWKNPAVLNLVKLSSTPLNGDSQELHCFIGRKAVRSLLQSRPNNWFQIDFQNYVIAPRFYTLRHYSSRDSHALRHWRLEGSLDGVSFETIRTHRGDTSLQTKGGSHTWELSTWNTGRRASRAYQIFRIVQTGENSSDYFSNLCLSGFEIYGFLVDRRTLTTDDYVQVGGKKELWLETQAPSEVLAEWGDIELTTGDYNRLKGFHKFMKPKDPMDVIDMDETFGLERLLLDPSQQLHATLLQEQQKRLSGAANFERAAKVGVSALTLSPPPLPAVGDGGNQLEKKNPTDFSVRGLAILEEAVTLGDGDEGSLNRLAASYGSERWKMWGDGPADGAGTRAIDVVVDPQFQSINMDVIMEAPHVLPEDLTEFLQKVPAKSVLRDPLKGYKINRRRIQWPDDKPGGCLIQLYYCDPNLLHYSETKGRACPNSRRVVDKQASYIEEEERGMFLQAQRASQIEDIDEDESGVSLTSTKFDELYVKPVDSDSQTEPTSSNDI